ncbi:hypothetical protein [Nocardioides campestrisoli]|uniref:hypothetical protein n=1 Tax=Nocardioides campestrisoli TaxID=2736757 RepID=UPI0015E7945D|nr:hypothetical protein [Nocardioides campestrisoli]
MTEQLAFDTTTPPAAIFRIGRGRTWHRARVLIESGRVVVRSQCGLLRGVGDGFTETFGYPTCSDCETP